jgi:copper homeostasis protein
MRILKCMAFRAGRSRLRGMVGLEVCVDTLEGVLAAKAGGAVRVELCAALSEGGLTPPVGLMRAAARAEIPCFAMIRPRSGLFGFSAAEIAMMHDDIRAAREAGLAGVVLGVQAADGRLDMAALGALCRAADGMGRTLHRVMDVVPDPFEALEQAIALGFDRVLTSGGAPEAPGGVGVIAEMVTRSAGRISVMPGCGLTPENVAGVVAATGAREVHAACNMPVTDAETFSDFDPPSGRMKTDQDTVRRMVAALKP